MPNPCYTFWHMVCSLAITSGCCGQEFEHVGGHHRACTCWPDVGERLPGHGRNVAPNIFWQTASSFMRLAKGFVGEMRHTTCVHQLTLVGSS